MRIIFLVLLLSVVASAQNDITSVDFKNFTYPAFCIGERSENVTVKNGEFSEEKQEDGYVDRFYFKVFDVAYGDLNGDKKPEAVVLTVCNTGGTGNFSEGFVFGMRSGKTELLTRIPGGDRAYGGLRGAWIENGLLIIDSNDVGETGGACCPEFVITTKHRLGGEKLVRSGTPLRRPLVPSSRVTFIRGASGKTLTVKIPAGESVRYIVGARGGQKLAVSVDSPNAALRLIEDANVTPGINNFLALLPASGDYTIEIENTSSEDLQITVNIKITQ